jgi:ABC-type branched-subunit amino acid transport system permease subunit
MNAERLAQILAALCLVIVAVMAGKPSFTNASQTVRGIADPGIALQTARNVDEIDAILSDAPSADREVMRLKQYIDFAFIATYAALSIVMAWALRRRLRWVALALVACTLAAAVFDVLENLEILRLLHLELSQTTPAAIQAIRAASFVKWPLVSLA